MKKSKQQFILFGTIIFLGSIFWFVKSPIFTLDKIKSAAIERDSNKLNKLINFETLRSSIKIMLLEPNNIEGDKPRTSYLASVVGGFLITPIIDRMVSPESLVFLMSGKIPNLKDQPETSKPIEIETSWEGLSRAKLILKSERNSNNSVVLIMERDGLDWKLVGIKRQMF
jgi:hypothetical protein